MNDLKALKAKLVGLMNRAFDAQIEIGRVLDQAKPLFSNEAEWVKWIIAEGLFQERQAQNYVAVSRFWDELSEKRRNALPMSWTKVLELSRLSATDLDLFLSLHNPKLMSRLQIHMAVQKMCGAKRGQRVQGDFFDSLNLPPADRVLELAESSSQSLPPERAADYALAFTGVALSQFGKLTVSSQHKIHMELSAALNAMEAVMSKAPVAS